MGELQNADVASDSDCQRGSSSKNERQLRSTFSETSRQYGKDTQNVGSPFERFATLRDRKCPR